MGLKLIIGVHPLSSIRGNPRPIIPGFGMAGAGPRLSSESEAEGDARPDTMGQE